MLKLRPIGKVNKGPSALWWPNFENVKKQKMDLITILIIPENMNPQSPSLETQWSFVKFVKILKNWLVWRFFAIILALQGASYVLVRLSEAVLSLTVTS